MRKFLLIFTLFWVTVSVSAQSDIIAKLKFEEAEEAYNKNDFFTTISRLDEAEKLLGSSNPKIMYLRIMAQAKLFEKDRSLLSALENNCQFYIKNYNGNVVEEKFKEVYRVYDRLTDYKDNADFHEGLRLFKEKNYEAALISLRRAAAEGHSPSFVRIGWLYENGLGLNKDYEQAMHWYKRAADKEYPEGLYYLGRMYFHGRGAEKSPHRALELFLKGAEKNNMYAIIGVGDVYFYQLQDYAEALPWYLKASEPGNHNIFYGLGYIYQLGGKGLNKDYSKAMDWYLKSAALGNSAAMNNIGVMYKNGQGVAKNYAKALDWYVKAAEKGNGLAPLNIASLYENGGFGIKRSRKLAQEWREKAVADAVNKKN